ncbi:MAG: CHAT domain-containing protein [Acidobacteria bacterium]|nr:CHAT domain-containing protein [Acidobacteriota bacterium]
MGDKLRSCGNEFNGKGEYLVSVQLFEAMRALAIKLDDQAMLAAALVATAGARTQLSDLAEAEVLARQALSLGERLGDKSVMAGALAVLAELVRQHGDYDQSRAYNLWALELFQAVGNTRRVAYQLHNVGFTYLAQGDFPKALDYLEKSASALKAAGNEWARATVLLSIAGIHEDLGDYARNRELLRESLRIHESLENKQGIASVEDAFGRMYAEQGDFVAARQAYEKALTLRMSIGEKGGVASTLINMGEMFQAEGNSEKAAEHFRRSLEIDAKVKNSNRQAEALAHLGQIYEQQGKPNLAVQSLKESLRLGRESGFKRLTASALDHLAAFHLRRNQLASAEECLKESLSLREQMANRAGMAKTLTLMAVLAYARKDFAGSVTVAQRAAKLASDLGQPEAQWRALTAAGRAQVALGKPQEAAQSFDAAIALIEGARVQAGDSRREQSLYFAERLTPYQERIALAVAGKRGEEALQYAERSKARVLLDAIQADREPVTKRMTEGERSKEQELRNALTALNRQVLLASQEERPVLAKVSALKQRRDVARAQYERFQSSLYVAHPELREKRGAGSVLTDFRSPGLLPTPSAVLLEFIVTPERTYLFVVRRGGVSVHEIRVTRRELARAITQFRTRLASRDLEAGDSARRLYDLLLAPARASLRGASEVVVAPDGVLWELPFQALKPAANRYLIEESAVSYVPSLTVLAETLRVRPEGGAASVLAFGNPAVGKESVGKRKFVLMDERLEPLPEAEKQVLALPAIYGGSAKVFTGRAALEERWKAEASRYDILHLATHGIVNPRNPLYSTVVLSAGEAGSKEDGLLEAWEIMELELKARLAVLSACETARGQVTEGEGVIGLMWAFFVAGTPATLVSQWKVESASSTALMVGFHQRWRAGANGVSKSQALREASLRLLKSSEYSHPFYWAGYILAGNPR